MFKKILAVVLAVSVLLSMTVVGVHAEEVSAERTTKFENAVTLLEELGAIPQGSSYTFDSEITKGQFVDMLAKIIPVSDGAAEPVFADVPATHANFKVIQGFAEAGYIDGYAGSFEPDRAITYNEALYILMNTMGYDDFMNLVAAYPAGGWQLAKQLDIKMTNKGAVVGDIFYLVYQALSTDMLAIDGMKQGSFVFKAEEGKTILEQYHNIEVETGILYNNGQFTIKNQYPVEDGAIVVTDTYYDIDEACQILPGCEVDVFHDIDSNEVLCVVATAENEIVEIDSIDIEGFRDMKYDYKKDGAKKTLKIKDGTDIVINGQLVTEIVDEDMVPANGKVIAIDNGTTSGYSVIYVKGYESFVVKSVVKENNFVKIYADAATGLNPVMANLEVDVPVVLDAEGNSISAEDIEIGTVVSVMGIEDGGFIVADEIVVCDETVTGDVTRIYRNETPALMIDGVKYPVSASAEYLFDTISPQSNMTFFVDFMGNIVALDNEVSGGMAYGYILNAKLAVNEEGEQVVRVELLSEIGSIINYYLCPERIYIDDVRSEKYYNPEDVLSNFTVYKNKVIRYDVNEEREINKVDFPESIETAVSPTVNNSLYLSNGAGEANLYWRKTYKTFSTTVMADENTIVFKIPERPEEAEKADYQVIRDINKIADGRYKITSYKVGKDTIASNVIVLKQNFENYSESEGYYVVKEVSQELNQYDEIVYSVTLDGQSGEKTYATKTASIVENPHAATSISDTYRAIESGDIVRCKFDETGTIITDFVICFQTREDNAISCSTIASGGDWNYANRVIEGYVYDMDDSLLSITTLGNINTAIDTENILLDSASEKYAIDSFKIFKLEKTDMGVNVLEGSKSDIKALRTSGGEYSRVVAVTGSATGKVLFVIE